MSDAQVVFSFDGFKSRKGRYQDTISAGYPVGRLPETLIRISSAFLYMRNRGSVAENLSGKLGLGQLSGFTEGSKLFTQDTAQLGYRCRFTRHPVHAFGGLFTLPLSE